MFLFSALCALMVASPCAGASFAASSLALSSLSSLSSPGTPAPYDTVLWWLQHSTDGVGRNSSSFSTTAHLGVAASNVLDVATLAPALHSVKIALPQLAGSSHKTHLAPLTQPAIPTEVSIVAPRYNATRRYVAHSLTAHEASYRAGTRTNSFPE